eukprot:158047-Pyramimonas_sp.AAC.3
MVSTLATRMALSRDRAEVRAVHSAGTCESRRRRQQDTSRSSLKKHAWWATYLAGQYRIVPEKQTSRTRHIPHLQAPHAMAPCDGDSEPIVTRHRHEEPIVARHRHEEPIITRHRHEEPIVTRRRNEEPIVTKHRNEEPIVTRSQS